MPKRTEAVDKRGWEHIWRQAKVPNRFASFAAPNSTLVEWEKTLPKGGFVLDVGCGMGRHCVWLGGRGYRVAGMDVSPTGVQRSIEACASKGIALDGRVCDMAALTWPDATFDAAFSTSTIHHHMRADMVRALDEIWRVLKPGGLVLLDFPDVNTLDYALLRQEVAAGGYLEPERNTFIDPRPNPRDIDGFLPHHFCDEADLRDLLKQFTILKLFESLKPAKPTRGEGLVGKWIVWARKE